MQQTTATSTNKILWLASWYPNETAPFDGDFIQRHARALALAQPVHVVHVVKEQSTAASAVRIVETITGNLRETVIYYKAVRTGLNRLDRLLSLLTYNRVFRNYLQQDFRVNGMPGRVHVHVAMRAGMVAMWLLKKWGLKYLVTEHWTGYYPYASENYYQHDFLFRFFNREVLKHAALLLPVSRDLGDTITRNICPVPFTVVPNVADTSMFYFTGDNTAPLFRFIHVSSMGYQKNIPGLMRSLQQLGGRFNGWECLMVGPADDTLKQYASELELGQRVRWTGELSYAEVAKELQQASAFVLFSRYETFSCVLIESACCGLPVIAPRLGPLPEIVDSENGILFEPGSEEHLTEAMADMMINYKRFNRKKISEKATDLYNYERVGKMMESIYEKLL